MDDDGVEDGVGERVCREEGRKEGECREEGREECEGAEGWECEEMGSEESWECGVGSDGWETDDEMMYPGYWGDGCAGYACLTEVWPTKLSRRSSGVFAAVPLPALAVTVPSAMAFRPVAPGVASSGGASSGGVGSSGVGGVGGQGGSGMHGFWGTDGMFHPYDVSQTSGYANAIPIGGNQSGVQQPGVFQPGVYPPPGGCGVNQPSPATWLGHPGYGPPGSDVGRQAHAAAQELNRQQDAARSRSPMLNPGSEHARNLRRQVELQDRYVEEIQQRNRLMKAWTEAIQDVESKSRVELEGLREYYEGELSERRNTIREIDRELTGETVPSPAERRVAGTRLTPKWRARPRAPSAAPPGDGTWEEFEAELEEDERRNERNERGSRRDQDEETRSERSRRGRNEENQN